MIEDIVLAAMKIIAGLIGSILILLMISRASSLTLYQLLDQPGELLAMALLFLGGIGLVMSCFRWN